MIHIFIYLFIWVILGDRRRGGGVGCRRDTTSELWFRVLACMCYSCSNIVAFISIHIHAEQRAVFGSIVSPIKFPSIVATAASTEIFCFVWLGLTCVVEVLVHTQCSLCGFVSCLPDGTDCLLGLCLCVGLCPSVRARLLLAGVKLRHKTSVVNP